MVGRLVGNAIYDGDEVVRWWRDVEVSQSHTDGYLAQTHLGVRQAILQGLGGVASGTHRKQMIQAGKNVGIALRTAGCCTSEIRSSEGLSKLESTCVSAVGLVGHAFSIKLSVPTGLSGFVCWCVDEGIRTM